MQNINPTEIGKRIKEAREEKRIDVPFIAMNTGLNKSTIYRYENGEVKRVKKPVIESIANILGVNPLWLTGESDIKHKITPNIGNRVFEDGKYSKNILYLRQKKGITQEDMATKLDLPLPYYKKIENGLVDITVGEALKIAEILELPEVEFLFKDLRKIEFEKNSYTTTNNKETITVYGKVCAGDGIEIFEDPIDEITNPYHRIKGDLFALQVQGDSMNNVVNDGMYAIIEKKEIVNNGSVAVIIVDNEIGLLKRFYQLDKSTVILKPDSSNQAHKAMIFENNDINRLKILGRYIGHVSPMVDFN